MKHLLLSVALVATLSSALKADTPVVATAPPLPKLELVVFPAPNPFGNPGVWNGMEAVALKVRQTSTSQSPTPLSYLFAYDFTARKVVALGSYTFASTKSYGPLSFGSIACLGSAIGGGGATAGLGEGVSIGVSKNLKLSAGGILGIFAGAPPHGIGFVGASGSF